MNHKALKLPHHLRNRLIFDISSVGELWLSRMRKIKYQTQNALSLWISMKWNGLQFTGNRWTFFCFDVMECMHVQMSTCMWFRTHEWALCMKNVQMCIASHAFLHQINSIESAIQWPSDGPLRDVRWHLKSISCVHSRRSNLSCGHWYKFSIPFAQQMTSKMLSILSI